MRVGVRESGGIRYRSSEGEWEGGGDRVRESGNEEEEMERERQIRGSFE